MLALSGKRFTGKDTLAAMLARRAQEQGVRVELFAFAAECKRLFVEERAREGEVVELARLLSEREYKERWRPAMTRFTERCLAQDPLFFCRAVASRAEQCAGLPVLTDLRLRQEREHLASRFELVVLHLERSDAARASSGWRYDPAADTHFTETELDDPALWTETLSNEGSLEALEEAAQRVLRGLLRSA